MGVPSSSSPQNDRAAAVAHELRTPLTSIAGFVELLLDGDAGALTPEQARYLGIIQNATTRLRLLVDELLAGDDQEPPAMAKEKRS